MGPRRKLDPITERIEGRRQSANPKMLECLYFQIVPLMRTQERVTKLFDFPMQFQTMSSCATNQEEVVIYYLVSVIISRIL